MRNSYLYLTVLGATLLASCSNEIESLEKTAQTNNKYASELVDVSKNFTLIGGYENSNGATRAEWNFDGADRVAQSKWAWKSTDVIGAAWVGRNYKGDAINHDFTASLSGKVLSNYQFDITKYSAAAVNDFASMTEANTTNDASAWTGRVKGAFQTNNLKMFGGDYIVYTPFDETLTEEGYITMKAPVELEQATLSDQGMFQAAGNANYFNAYGYSTKMVGGQPEIGANIAAGSFALRPLNRIVAVRLTTSETVTNVKKLYIYSENSEIFTQNGLSASKIAQGEKEAAVPGGKITTLPYEEKNDKIETTTAVRTTLTTPGDVAPNTLNGTAPAGTNVVTADAAYIDTYNEKYIYSMLMPVNFQNEWEVIVTKTTQKAAKRTVKPMQINPSSDYVVIAMGEDADKNADFNTYVAFDCAEFETAATAAQGDIVYDAPTIIHKWPFRILREIEYGNEPSHTDVALQNVTVEGQKITVVDGATLTIDNNTAFAEGFKIVNKGDIIVKAGADLSNLEIVNEGEIVLQNGAVLSATVTGKGTITVVSDARASITGSVEANEVNLVTETSGQTILDVTGSLTIYKQLSIPTENCKFYVKGSGNVTVKNGATVENYGTVNLDGANTVMKVESGAEFIDRIGSHMGGYALKSDNMQVYGEYICEVNTQALFDDVMVQKKAVVTRIRITPGITGDQFDYTLDNSVTDYKSTNVYQEDKQVDLEVNLVGVELTVSKNNQVTFGDLIVNKATTITTKTGANSDASKLVLTKNVVAFQALTLSDGAKLDVALDVFAEADYTVGESAVVNVKGETNAANGATKIGENSEYTTKSLVVEVANVTVKTGSSLTVEEDLVVYKNGSITFQNNLTAEIGGKIDNRGTFTILNAISAQSTTAIVRCAGYSNTGTWGTNNLPIVR